MKQTKLVCVAICAGLVLAACSPAPLKMSDHHITPDGKSPAGKIPKPVFSNQQDISAVERVEGSTSSVSSELMDEVYSVVVNNVDLRELLFALSRDAEINVDVSSEVNGTITMNAVDQTLFQILDRIVTLSNIRYSMHNGVLTIEKDAPYFVHYNVGYLNMGRSSKSNVSISTEVATTGVGAQSDSSSEGGGDNSSSTVIENSSSNNFWQTLTQNIEAILNGKSSTSSALSAVANGGGEGAAESDEDDDSGGASLIVNSESGLLAVKATKKQHREVGEFLDRVLDGAKRQVLIEASIVEVSLNDSYQAGVDWSRLAQPGSSGLSFVQDLIGTNLSEPPVSTLSYTGGGQHDIDATIKMLSEFGDIKVLSTPKLMVLNNQTALLKVVDNIVYFSISVDEDVQENFINRTFTTEIHTVPVGLVMGVTPHVTKLGEVILNVRPTISRVSRFVEDPNPALAASDVQSLIPEISVREMESMMKVNGGDTAIIGGLMQDKQNSGTSGIPGLSSVPYLGKLFSYENNNYTKSELIVFIRPVVIKQASLRSKELGQYKSLLPDQLDSNITE
ncbi:MAG: pilus (MSHA type) biogenesis protein MshL [Gammaproteobacteria bacterium]|nr:pilus (MSHA type) biogenesis protein MshL [Gammaproteobacteria bacterium]